MDNLFQEKERAILVQRIHRLTPDTTALWGKMNPAQMVAHLRLPLEVGMGKLVLPSMFLMKLMGPMIKKIILSDKPLKKNSPTAKAMLVNDTRNFDVEKVNLLQTLEDFAAMGNSNKLLPRHPYFGKMSNAEWNIFQQRHFDHHLSQFGV